LFVPDRRPIGLRRRFQAAIGAIPAGILIVQLVLAEMRGRRRPEVAGLARAAAYRRVAFLRPLFAIGRGAGTLPHTLRIVSPLRFRFRTLTAPAHPTHTSGRWSERPLGLILIESAARAHPARLLDVQPVHDRFYPRHAAREV